MSSTLGYIREYTQISVFAWKLLWTMTYDDIHSAQAAFECVGVPGGLHEAFTTKTAAVGGWRDAVHARRVAAYINIAPRVL